MNQTSISSQAICPFCKFQIPVGATVCQACGAYLTTKGDAASPMGSLMRMGLWANTMGLIIFAALYGSYNLASEGLSKSLTQQKTGSISTCNCLYTFDLKTSAITEKKYGVREIGQQACETYSSKDIELRKKFCLDDAARDAKKKNYFQSMGNLKLDKVETASRDTYSDKPLPAAQVVLKLVLAVLVLVAGFILYRLASKIWVAIFGRVTDPVWVRKV